MVTFKKAAPFFDNGIKRPKMKVVIVGSGIGGLACAVACAQESLKVTILERAPQLVPVGPFRRWIMFMKVLYLCRYTILGRSWYPSSTKCSASCTISGYPPQIA